MTTSTVPEKIAELPAPPSLLGSAVSCKVKDVSIIRLPRSLVDCEAPNCFPDWSAVGPENSPIAAGLQALIVVRPNLQGAYSAGKTLSVDLPVLDSMAA